MKICKKCKVSKNLTGFAKRDIRLGRTRYRPFCKSCLNLVKGKITNERRLLKKIRAIDFLGGKCVRCGYRKNPYALEFNHKNPRDKIKNLTRLIGDNKWKEIAEELKKCELLCANCHRDVTYPLYKDYWGHP